MKPPRLILDSHLDLAMNAMEWNRDLTWPIERIRRIEVQMTDRVDRANNTVCFPEMRRGGVGLCVATWIARQVSPFSRLSGFLSQSQAWAHCVAQMEWYREMEAAGHLFQIRSRADLEKHLALWQQALATAPDSIHTLPIGYVLSLENADPIVSWRHLERAWDFGLRAIGPAHYGPGVHAHGTDDVGPLPERGKELLREMDRLGFILDATHYCDECFWEALDIYQGPVWASHSACRTLANWNRQFSDEQIRALIQRGAVIGMPLDAIMLVTGWTWLKSKPQDFNLRIERVVDHIDHICQLAGNTRHVGIGTDLDGGYGREQVPMDLDSIADLQKLDGLLAARGYSDADIDAIFHGNFLRFLRQAWK
jgi:membrane dipeptidase